MSSILKNSDHVIPLLRRKKKQVSVRETPLLREGISEYIYIIYI